LCESATSARELSPLLRELSCATRHLSVHEWYFARIVCFPVLWNENWATFTSLSWK